MGTSLYKEFAIDPDVMARWEWFLPIHEMFGFENGRLIAEFPGKWRRQVMQKAEQLINEGSNSPMTGIFMIEVLRSEEFRAALYSSGRQPDEKAATWLEKAQSQDPPFDAIVTENLDEEEEGLLKAELGFWKKSAFKQRRQCRIKRSADELVGAPERLLRKSREIRLVDPYFDPRDNRPFVRMVDFLHEARRPGETSIEIYTRPEIRRDGELIKPKKRLAEFSRNLDPELPSGWKVTVHLLETGSDEESENLHPRFLLTELGGVQYDYGLGEGKGTTVVTLLDEDFRKQLWEEYSPETTTFCHHPEFPSVVIGE